MNALSEFGTLLSYSGKASEFGATGIVFFERRIAKIYHIRYVIWVIFVQVHNKSIKKFKKALSNHQSPTTENFDKKYLQKAKFNIFSFIFMHIAAKCEEIILYVS
jgi:hypothetical protein